MGGVFISLDTKTEIKEIVRKGHALPAVYSALLGNDIEFAQSLVSIATEEGNTAFLKQVHSMIASSTDQANGKAANRVSSVKSRRRNSRKSKTNLSKSELKPTGKIHPKASATKSIPSGKSFKQFLIERGDYNPRWVKKSEWVTFVQGGSPGLGKRR
jgi:hypothetical protein